MRMVSDETLWVSWVGRAVCLPYVEKPLSAARGQSAVQLAPRARERAADTARALFDPTGGMDTQSVWDVVREIEHLELLLAVQQWANAPQPIEADRWGVPEFSLPSAWLHEYGALGGDGQGGAAPEAASDSGSDSMPELVPLPESDSEEEVEVEVEDEVGGELAPQGGG